MTEYGFDSWCFGAKGTVGFIIMCAALSMDKSLEKDPTELINCSLVARTKSNMRDVWKGVKLPELWKAILDHFNQSSELTQYFETTLNFLSKNPTRFGSGNNSCLSETGS